MKANQENPPRTKGETAMYEDDPFELGKIDDSKLSSDKDFLPRPEDLVFRPKGVKITITLSEDSLVYFKKQAVRLQRPYQRMIRNLIDEYVRQIKHDR